MSFVTHALVPCLALALAADAHAAGHLLVKLSDDTKTAADARDAVERTLAPALRAELARAQLTLRFERRSLAQWLLVLVAHEDGTPANDAELAALAATVRVHGEKLTGIRAIEPTKTMRALRTPNDEFYDFTWGLPMSGIDLAWDVTVGSSSQRIGVVDSGMRRDHVDLAAKDAFGFDFISDPAMAADGNGRDADYSDDNDASHFHGTHVAGTIGALANDGTGIPGVNWNAQLVTARALADSGDMVDIMEAAAWLAGYDVDGAPAIGADRVTVINMSLGSLGACSAYEQEVIDLIVNVGVAVVAAAGNEGNDVPVGAPANCDGVIAVGAFGPTGELATYSNMSARIDVIAPGGEQALGDEAGILSADGASDFDWKFLQGTSMAAPHVAGVVSLMQAVNPTLSPRQIREILRASPFTCGGCSGHAALAADDAVAQAQTTAGELGGATCPAHASPAPDGDGCVCDAGFDVNASRTGCVANGSDGPGSDDDGGNDDNDSSNDSNAGGRAGDACDPRRGNWDCEKGFGCVDDACVAGAQGDRALGESCRVDAECDSGLCSPYDAICTRPCDDGCGEDQFCDDEAIPGGMCELTLSASMGCAQTSGGTPAVFAILALALRIRRRG